MLEQILTLQWGGFYGGDVGSLLSYWEQIGFFSYILPFLLIFALVFGILTRVKVFDNKSINGVIALVIGLLALQFNFVPMFFSEIFPRLGVGLAVILAILILAGLFLDPKNKVQNYVLLGIGAVIFIVVLVQTFGWLGWSNSYLWNYNWSQIAAVAIVIIIITIIWSSIGERKKIELPEHNPILFAPYKGS